MNDGYLTGDELIADDLTWREQEVLHLLAERLTNREIADQLHLAESTVKDYVGNILSKLFVKNRRQAVKKAKNLGLLDDDQISVSISIQTTNLPAEPTPFVGRKDELADIKQLLKETRLLTLAGPGGIGKSRLALKVAIDLERDFKDGVYFVALAPITSPDHIIQTIAETLNFPLATHEDPLLQLLRYFRNRQLLLVIDNFEHLLTGVDIVSEIIQAAPGVRILVTSRERLNLISETMLIVRGMTLPDIPITVDVADFDAITLFNQSANKVYPGFNPSKDEVGSIAKISSIVQGLPLAIELSAAWLQILSLDEIVEELEKGPDILVTEAHDSPQRHRSMRNVFDHSWSLLNQYEKDIFLQLSVFRGGFSREAAEKVTNASIKNLLDLVNKSLMSRDPDSGRFEVHELLRQFAQERLEEKPQAHQSALEAHAKYHAEFMQLRWEQLKGEQQLSALSEIEADLENIRAAFRYYLNQNNSSQTLKFIMGLWMVHWIRGWNLAGVQLFEEAVRIHCIMETEQDAELKALALAFQGYFMAWLDLSEQGYKFTKESIHILEGTNRPEALVFAIDSFLINCYFQNRYAEQIEVTQEMLNLAVKIGDKWLLAFTSFAGGMAALIDDDYAKARQVGEFQLKLCEEIGDVIGSTLPLILLGHAAYATGENERARSYYLRCKRISRATGFQYSFQTSSKYLAKVELSLGRITEAEKNLRQCLKMTIEIGFVRDIINLIFEYARLRVAQSDVEGSIELLAFVRQHPVSTQSRLLEGRIRDSAEALLAELELGMDQIVFQAALEQGEEMDLEIIVADLVD